MSMSSATKATRTALSLSSESDSECLFGCDILSLPLVTKDEIASSVPSTLCQDVRRYRMHKCLHACNPFWFSIRRLANNWNKIREVAMFH